MNIKPLIFLAFSNDRSGKQSYLEALKEERVVLQKALQQGEKEGRYEVHIETDATIDDIIRVFQDADNRDRIAVFHYAGHGTPTGLMLEDVDGVMTKLASADGLAQLFDIQKNLKLVFLNACATQDQVNALRAKNIPNIIATTRSIKDKMAVQISKRFYEALGQKHDVKSSYDTMEGALVTETGKKRKDLTEEEIHTQFLDEEADRGLIWGEQLKSSGNKFPWILETDDANGSWSIVESGIFGEQPNIDVFVAYDKADEVYKESLRKHLTLLKRFKQINTFEMEDVYAHQEGDKVMKDKLLNAKMILLLISVNFLASDSCYDIESIAMQRHELGTAAVIPIYLSAFDNEGEFIPEFAKLKGLPSNGEPVSKWRNKDEAFTDIAKGIRRVVEHLKKK